MSLICICANLRPSCSNSCRNEVSKEQLFDYKVWANFYNFIAMLDALSNPTFSFYLWATLVSEVAITIPNYYLKQHIFRQNSKWREVKSSLINNNEKSIHTKYFHSSQILFAFNMKKYNKVSLKLYSGISIPWHTLYFILKCIVNRNLVFFNLWSCTSECIVMDKVIFPLIQYNQSNCFISFFVRKLVWM